MARAMVSAVAVAMVIAVQKLALANLGRPLAMAIVDQRLALANLGLGATLKRP